MHMGGINPASPRAKYRQLADLLREQILAGTLSGSLPREKAMADDYGVSLTTLRQALTMLRQEALIVTARGQLARVRPGRMDAGQRYRAAQGNYRSDPDAESAFAREHGVPWSAFDIDREITIEPAPLRVAVLLGLDVGDEVYARRFAHSTDGVLLRLSTSYLPMSFAGTALVDPASELVPGGTIAQLGQHGYQVHRVRTGVQVRSATPFEADMLNLTEPAPKVMESLRAMYLLCTGHAIEVAEHVFAPDRGDVLYFDTFVTAPSPGETPD